MVRPFLRILTLIILLSIQLTGFSQVTLVSNNTSLQEGGVVNGKAVLIAKNDSIWVTDGTPAGTKKLTTKVSFVDSGGIALYKNRAFFTGKNSTNGIELWVTNGTDTGTKLVKDIWPKTKSSVPRNFFVFNNKLYFTANDSTHGNEIWTTDGITTVLLKDINLGVKNGIVNSPQFYADSTILLFIANNTTNGKELWKTNGTAAGTLLVKDITPGTGSSSIGQIIRLAGTQAIFSLAVPNGFFSKLQVWKTDGTAVGTTLLKDFKGLSGFFPPWFFSFKGKIYFTAADSATNKGGELWVTNGTPAGTLLVKDIYPGTNGSNPFLFDAIIIGNKFFFPATTGTNGMELWGSDGTLAGTTLIKDINPGTASSNLFILKNYNFTTNSPNFSDTSTFHGKIFIIADSLASGRELWITNGTTAGTLQVKNIGPKKKSGIVDSTFSYFYTSAALYFSANDSIKGLEPWKSNGTNAGTINVANISPGTKSSFPLFLFIFNNQLYLNANNGDNTLGKTDLFKVTATVLPLYNLLVVSEKLELLEDALDLNLSPNPVQSQLNLKFSATEAGNVSIRIFDDNGKTLLQQNLGNNKSINQTINVSTLPQGLYFLQLIKGKEVKIAKFIKE
jgi:ELWxxDGT repeat protein